MYCPSLRNCCILVKVWHICRLRQRGMSTDGSPLTLPRPDVLRIPDEVDLSCRIYCPICLEIPFTNRFRCAIAIAGIMTTVLSTQKVPFIYRVITSVLAVCQLLHEPKHWILQSFWMSISRMDRHWQKYEVPTIVKWSCICRVGSKMTLVESSLHEREGHTLAPPWERR